MNIDNAVNHARDTIINLDCCDELEYINDVANIYAADYNEYLAISNRLIAILEANS